VAKRYSAKLTTAQLLRVAGKMPDRAAAAIIGCCQDQVRRYRHARGIPAYGMRDQLAEWWEEARTVAGTMPDRVVAEQYGVDRSRIAMLRVKHGIAAYKGPRGCW
jgi:hypothetical protein